MLRRYQMSHLGLAGAFVQSAEVFLENVVGLGHAGVVVQVRVP